MDFTTVDWPQIGAGLIGLGVIAKGIADYVARTKSPSRGCLYGDSAHDELLKSLRTLQEALTIHTAQSTETHDMVLVIRTILEAKK